MNFGTVTRQATLDGEIAFKEMLAAFTRAWMGHRAHRWESSFSFADRPVHMRIVGSKLAEQMMGVFSHLLVERNGTGSHLKIDLWDESITSISCPLKAEPVEDHVMDSTWYVEFGLILGSSEDRFVGCQRPQVVTFFDRANQHLVGWVAGSGDLCLYDRGKPLLFPLLLWHSDQGADVIHACLISKRGQGVLLAGKGGVGKSTSALACVGAGFNYLGDDYIGLEATGNGSFLGHSLYSSTWLMADHLSCFPRLIPHAIYAERPEHEKTLALLSQLCPSQLARVAPIQLLILPRVTNGASARIRPASKGEALFALAPKSLILLPSSRARALDKLTKLTEQVPGYWLELGQDLNQIPNRIEELLDFGR